jgi:steroid delta-isomerase
MPTDAEVSERVLREVCDAFSRMSPGDERAVEELMTLYDDGVVFADPLQRIEGRAALAAMNVRLVRRARDLRVRIADRAAAGDQAFLTWQMDYRYRLGPAFTIDGISHLRLRGGKVVEHRDYWDALSTAVGVVPGARNIYRTLAARLA